MKKSWLIGITALVGLIVSACRASSAGPSVDVRKALEMAGDKSTLVVDVRTEEEFRDGHIPGAMHIPLGELVGRLNELPPNKDAQILVYCFSGNRSAQAQKIMKNNGYTNVSNMKGGVMVWRRAGFPLDK